MLAPRAGSHISETLSIWAELLRPRTTTKRRQRRQLPGGFQLASQLLQHLAGAWAASRLYRHRHWLLDEAGPGVGRWLETHLSRDLIEW
jgi:hypothetical protein